MSAFHKFTANQFWLALEAARFPKRVFPSAAHLLCVARLVLLLIGIPLAWAQNEPSLLQIHIAEGDGASYGLGSRATRGVTVQVTDETGRPVEGASVSFRLPDEGPTGTFSGGGRLEIATTRADGRAGVWGMQWNRTAGALEVRITAAKGTARAGTVCPLFLTDAVPGGDAVPKLRSGHKWLWVAVAVAGAAGGTLAAAAVGAKTSPQAGAAAVSAPRIGTPSITLGPR